MERLDAVNPDEGGNETPSRFLDRERERSPGPGVLVVQDVAVLTDARALRRRKAPLMRMARMQAALAARARYA